MSDPNPTEEVQEPVQIERNGKRYRKRNVRLKMPAHPPIPIKALWEWASPDQKNQAQAMAIAIMEYWMGRSTKLEIAQKLGIPPLRVWQMSQQAISGMVAGLLTQPKVKSRGVTMNPEDDPKILRKRIAELERHVAMQDRLIAVLREMPGCRDASIPMNEILQGEKNARKAKKAKIQAGARHEGGAMASGGSEDDPTN